MKAPEAVAAAVLLALLGAGSARAGDVSEQGKRIYEIRCAPCHGDTGAGDGPAAVAISPPPRNFREPGFWNGRPPAQLRLVVAQGRPGTMMAPFKGVLSDAEIDAVVAYLVSAFKPAAH